MIDTALVVAAVIAMTAIRWLLDDLLQDRIPYFLPVAALAVVAWAVRAVAVLAGGVVALLLAIVLFVAPRGTLGVESPGDGVSLAVAAAVILCLSFAGAASQRSRTRALATAAEADRMTTLLRAVSEATDDLIFAKDLQGRMQLANPATLRLAGKPADEILGRTEAEWAADPAQAAAVMADDRRIMSTGRPETLEEVFTGVDGPRTFLSHKQPLRDSSGRIVGILGTARDISDRKASEDALRDREKFARQVLDNLFTFVAVLDVDGTLVQTNRAPLEIAGVSAESVLGKKFWEGYWWTYSTRVAEQIQDAVRRAARGEVLRYDIQARIANDKLIWVDFQIAPLRDAEGRITHLIPSGTDITARKQAELALRESEHFHRQTVASIPGMVFTNRPDGSCDFVSDQWVEFTGVPAEEHLGDGWVQVLHQDDRERAAAAWRSAVEGTGRYDLEYRVRRHDGDYEWFKVQGRAIRDASGRIVRWFGTAVNVTDLKLTEEALRRSEAKLEAVIEGLPVGVSVADPAGRVLSLNPAGMRVHGLQSRDEMPTSLQQFAEEFELLDPAGRTMPLEEWPLSRALRGEYVSEFEVVLRRRSVGESRVISYSAVPVRDQRGEPVLIVFVMHDVTERKQADEAIRESEARFRTMADGLPLVIWVHDAQGKQEFVNRTFAEFFGVCAEEMTGDRWQQLMHPVDGPVYLTEFLACLRQRRPFHAPVRVRRADGQWRWIESYGRPRLTASGEFRGFVGASVDITARREAEIALRDSEARFRTIAETTPDIIFTSRPDGSDDYLNQRFYEYTGHEQSSGLGMGWLGAVHADDRERIRARWLSCMRTGEPFSAEYRLVAADGASRWFAGRADPLRNETGRIVHWVGCCSDIHDAKAAQDILSGINERLNAAVVAKTAELEQSHRALRVSERMASLGTFAAGMGHDLANLLLPVRTRLEELLLDPSLSESARADINAVGGSMAHIQSLCRGLRLFAMDPEAEAEVEGTTSLLAWAADLERVLRTALPSTITLECRVPAELPLVAIAPHRLSQAILNLVQNARDAILGLHSGAAPEPSSAEFAGVIEIGAAPEHIGESAGVRLWVRDNGPGMPEDVRARCLEPFFTTKTRGLGGTGLGLSIVHGIVSKTGGRVDIQSAPGQGTTFTLFLPVLTPRATHQRPAAVHTPTSSRPRALVQLADQRAGAFVTTILVARGFEVNTAETASGRSASADLWVTQATPAALRTARTLHAAGAPAIIACGGDEQWRSLGAVVIPPGAPLSHLKASLDALLISSNVPPR